MGRWPSRGCLESHRACHRGHHTRDSRKSCLISQRPRTAAAMRSREGDSLHSWCGPSRTTCLPCWGPWARSRGPERVREPDQPLLTGDTTRSSARKVPQGCNLECLWPGLRGDSTWTVCYSNWQGSEPDSGEESVRLPQIFTSSSQKLGGGPCKQCLVGTHIHCF